MPTGLENIRARVRADRRVHRRLTALLVLAWLAAWFFLLCWRGRGMGFASPAQVGRALYTFFRLRIAKLLSRPLWTQRDAVTAAVPRYAEIVARFRRGFMMSAAGAILAQSGLIYQVSTRNAMAVPTMLGVSAGVNLARVILVLQLGEAVYTLTKYHYLLCYGITAAALIVILLGGRLAGGKRTSVADILIVGTVVNRILQMAATWLSTTMDTDTLTIWQEFSEKSYELYDSFSGMAALCAVSAALLLPVLCLRFRYNAIAFTDEDARSMGVRPGGLRVYGLTAGAVMTTTAMIFCGNVGMIAMIVPHLCRYIFGAEFTELLGANAVLGALLMILGYILSNCLRFYEYTFPLGSVISLLAIPLLIWAMLRQRRGWE